MLVLFELIDDLSEGKVEFYTIKLEGKDVYEFEEFEDKDFPDHKAELYELYNVIDEMRLRGAKKRYFKFEENAHAMPYVSNEIKESNKKDWGIRLYCIFINEGKVVLLNGDIKTHRNPRMCELVRKHFDLARRIGTILDKAILNKEINILEPRSLDQFEIMI